MVVGTLCWWGLGVVAVVLGKVVNGQIRQEQGDVQVGLAGVMWGHVTGVTEAAHQVAVHHPGVQ